MRRVPGQSLVEFALAAVLTLVVCLALIMIFGAGEILGALGLLP